MIRVCVAGVTGWTGRAVADAIEAADDLELVARRLAFRSRLVLVGGRGARRGRGGRARRLHARGRRQAERRRCDRARGRGRRGLERDVGGRLRRDRRGWRERTTSASIAAGNFSLTAALLLRFSVEAARHLDEWEVIDYASARSRMRRAARRARSPSGSMPSARRASRSARRGARRARGTRRNDRRHPGPLGEAAELHGLDRDGLRRRGRAAVDSTRRGRERGAVRRRHAPRRPGRGGRMGLTRGLDQLLG